MSEHTPGPLHVGPYYRTDVESREGRVAAQGYRELAEAGAVPMPKHLLWGLGKIEAAIAKAEPHE